jgi:hypothetical protein
MSTGPNTPPLQPMAGTRNVGVAAGTEALNAATPRPDLPLPKWNVGGAPGTVEQQRQQGDVRTPVGTLTNMAPMPRPDEWPPQAPMIPEGMDKVLLMRMFPDTLDSGGAEQRALQQGRETQEAGQRLVANQQISQQDEENERAAVDDPSRPPQRPGQPQPQQPPQQPPAPGQPPQRPATEAQPQQAYANPQQPSQQAAGAQQAPNYPAAQQHPGVQYPTNPPYYPPQPPQRTS